MKTQIRQPIVTVAGHVDHGKTSLLDAFRGSSVQEGEAGGITQKISFTKYPLEQIKKACPLIEKQGIKLEIPGFLFIDTPGHAAFTNLRKRGGSLADLAILVVNAKEGIKPQTAEVLQILKANKTPFLIAFNKIDMFSGWKKQENSLKESVESQAINVSQEFQESILTFQGNLQEHGFNSALYYEISDFTKQVAIVPCSARTKEGIPELLLVLCGLSEKFLRERLKLSDTPKGVILEIKKTKGLENVEAIIYDGVIKENDEMIVASLNGEPIITKVRSLEEIEPLSFKYKNTKEAKAATGLRMHLTSKEGILSGMLFQKVDNNLDKIKEVFKKEVSGVLNLDKNGIIIKADSLGSLEALITLLKQQNINIVKAGIGPIGKVDLVSAKANLEINSLDSVIIGFNVDIEPDLKKGKVKIITDTVIYKLIENLQKWRTERQAEIEKERLMELATICKLEILHKYMFRNSNPAIFGIRVLSGRVRTGLPLINEKGEEVARVKGLELEKESVNQATEGQEVAMSLPGTNFERQLKETKYLYSALSDKQIKEFKKNSDLLSSSELNTLSEIEDIKKKTDS